MWERLKLALGHVLDGTIAAIVILVLAKALETLILYGGSPLDIERTLASYVVNFGVLCAFLVLAVYAMLAIITFIRMR